jgi:FkbM family methyltransferase
MNFHEKIFCLYVFFKKIRKTKGLYYFYSAMKKTKLRDGTVIYCLRKPEAKMLDHHVEGYLQHGIAINDGDVIFDVGANIGVFGIRALQYGPNVSAYCFEPIPDIAEVLQKNADSIDKNRMCVFKHGISDFNTTASFTYFPNTPALSTSHPEHWDENPKAFRDAVKGTMKNPPVGMKWMRLIPPIFAGIIARQLIKGSKIVNCELKTLSTVIVAEEITKIDLLKIDCEGAEWAVLQGIESNHWPLIKSIVIEVHDTNNRLQKVRDLLSEKGFSLLYDEREKGLEETQMFNLFALRG